MVSRGTRAGPSLGMKLTNLQRLKDTTRMSQKCHPRRGQPHFTSSLLTVLFVPVLGAAGKRVVPPETPELKEKGNTS